MERQGDRGAEGAEHGGADAPEGTASERPDGERTSMDRESPAAEDDLVRREERAAAAEAGAVGGPAPEPEGDEASRPVEEAGGGEAEGFEQSERELREEASHGEGKWSPAADAFTPEAETDRAPATYSEPDEIDPMEVTSDPDEGPDDPGQGPGIAPER